jgi:hypothetical protein
VWRPPAHDPKDPSPWLALALDESVPLHGYVKGAWLNNEDSWSRQFLLPVVRPLARLVIILVQLIKILIPNAVTSSWLLHRILAFGLKTFVRPEANYLILRHFWIGSENLAFIAANVPGVHIPLSPLRPRNLDDLEDHLFVKHDLNLFNFVINLNREMKAAGAQLRPIAEPDFSVISRDDFPLDPLPDDWTNVLDLETAIELFTPLYQLLLTDNDVWRASNSLQLDETIGIYAATILSAPEKLALVNNKHPLVPLSTLRAGHRLVLHGLASEILHTLLVREKLAREQARPSPASLASKERAERSRSFLWTRTAALRRRSR